MNQYFQLLQDLVALMETPQWAAISADIKAIEGGGGNALVTSGTSAALRSAIQTAAAQPAAAKPAVVPPKSQQPAAPANSPATGQRIGTNRATRGRQ